MDRSVDLRSFLPGLYPVAALLVVAPLAELIGIGWPARPSEVAWRFGSLGLGFGGVTVQILGIALAMITAAALEHRRTLRSIALFALLGATVMIAGIARFVLDYGQLRAAIPAADQAGFDTSAFRALVSAVLAAPVLLALGARGLTHTRPEQPPVGRPHRTHGPDRAIIPFRQPGRRQDRM